MINCWEEVDLLALLCVVFSCVFSRFPYGVSGQVCYLIESSPDRCLLLTFIWVSSYTFYDILFTDEEMFICPPLSYN